MKLSTRSRYGTRLMMGLAEHYPKGPLRLNSIAVQQGISLQYLEQIIIPLKKAAYIKRVRGPKGGHILAKPPAEITMGEIVALLEEGAGLAEGSFKTKVCERSSIGSPRFLWQEPAQAMLEKLRSITLADMLKAAPPKRIF